jgi:hypothetical protein
MDCGEGRTRPSRQLELALHNSSIRVASQSPPTVTIPHRHRRGRHGVYINASLFLCPSSTGSFHFGAVSFDRCPTLCSSGSAQIRSMVPRFVNRRFVSPQPSYQDHHN